MLGVTAVATHPQKTVLEAAALEVCLELPLDIAGQRRTPRRQLRLEFGIVFFNKLVKEGAFRPMPRVNERSNTRTGFPADR
jgi:hypothetical protein